MTSSPDNSNMFALQENITFATDPNQFLLQFTTLYRQMATNTNVKEIGIYHQDEIINGQQYYIPDVTGPPNPPLEQMQIYRTVINTGALLNALPTAVNHGLNGGAAVPATWMFTRVYGFARAPGTPSWIPLSNGGIYDCALEVTPLQVIITPTVNLAAYTESYIILEYWKA